MSFAEKIIRVSESGGKKHMGGSRGETGGPDPTPLKNHKIKGVLSILVRVV